MSEPTKYPEPIELTRRGSDEVVAYACGTCGNVHQDIRIARHCHIPHTCACGAECERHYIICPACMSRDRTARETKRIAGAARVPLAEYDFEYVWFDGNENGTHVDDAPEEAAERGETFAWACYRSAWPHIDATDLIESAFEDYHDAVRERLPVSTLQKLLDEWIASLGECTAYQQDDKRIVDLPPPEDDDA